MKNLRLDVKIIIVAILIMLSGALVCDLTNLDNFGVCLFIVGLIVLAFAIYLFFDNDY